MERIELELRETMVEHATKATEIPPLRQTIRRARRRQAAKVSLVAVTSILVAVTGAGLFVRDAPAPVRVAEEGPGTDGAFGFDSTPGTPPVVATGVFRGASWQLTATPRDAEVVLELSLAEGDARASNDVTVMAGDSAIAAQRVLGHEMLDGARVVYGAVMPSVTSLEVDVADGEGTVIRPHRFGGTTDPLALDYFVAFVPEASPGFVRARDELGIDVGSSAFGGVETAPHVVAAGKAGDTAWSLEFAPTRKDRFCLVFSAGADPSDICMTRAEMEEAEPLAMLTFERGDVLGIAAIISDEVGHVRLAKDGREFPLPWFQPPDEDLAEWPIRLVVVALEPDATGLLRAYAGDGTLLDENPFAGTPAP